MFPDPVPFVMTVAMLIIMFFGRGKRWLKPLVGLTLGLTLAVFIKNFNVSHPVPVIVMVAGWMFFVSYADRVAFRLFGKKQNGAVV
jgi:uncharacterized membrane protein